MKYITKNYFHFILNYELAFDLTIHLQGERFIGIQNYVMLISHVAI